MILIFFLFYLFKFPEADFKNDRDLYLNYEKELETAKGAPKGY